MVALYLVPVFVIAKPKLNVYLFINNIQHSNHGKTVTKLDYSGQNI